MSVPNGFKQTEVGVIPQDWKILSLGKCADILTGFPFPSSGYSNDGFKLLRGSNVKRGVTDWSKENTKYWKNVTKDIKAYQLEAGDIVIAMDGSLVGKSFAQISEDDLPALLLQRVARIRTDYVDINYISHLVCGNYFTNYCEQIKTSSAIPHISPKDIKDFQIPLPPTRAEQTAIAAVLSDTDALIEGGEKLLEKKRRIKQGAMQELLRPKEGWKEVLLCSIADILTGFPFSSSGYSNDGIKLLRGSNVKRGNIDWSKDNTKYWKCITNDIKNYELQAGDVVIAMDGSLVGKSFAQISEHDIPALLLQRVARIRTDKVDINYISHLVCGNYFTIHCEQIKTSSAIPHISPKDIRDFQIPLPPTRAEQATIADILSDMDAEIEQLETQLVKYRQLKTGMMQELLTGKKRLV